jgi:hypothetical protein
MVYVVTGDDCDLDRALALSLADQQGSQGQVRAWLLSNPRASRHATTQWRQSALAA